MTPKNLREFARSNGHAWPGGYPMALLMADGECLCAACVRANFRRIRECMRANDQGSDWSPVDVFIHWEGEPLSCANCYKDIPSAYTVDDGKATPREYEDSPSCAKRYTELREALQLATPLHQRPSTNQEHPYMSNMSYCRWQNTYTDLRDCAADLEERMEDGVHENDRLSHEERVAREQLFMLIPEMLTQIGVDHDIDTHAIAAALKALP